MSDRPYLVVSGDAHAGPRLEEDLRRFCPSKHMDEFDGFVAAHREALAAGQRQWSNESFAGSALAASEAQTRGAMMTEAARQAGLAMVDDIVANRGSWDVDARLADMDADGITSEVIFAGAQNREALPWAGRTGASSMELQSVGGHMWDEWLAEFCSAAPERLLGVAQIPMWDIDEAIREVRWAKAHGLRAINLPAPRPELAAYNEDVYEPFWEVVEEVDLPLVTHSASGESASGAKGRGAAVLFLSEVLWLSRRGLGQLVFGGVFDRHPTLQVAFVEQRGNWVQHTMAELDSVYLGVPKNSTLSLLGAPTEIPDKLPSEYWRTNCIIADSFMARYEAEMRHEIGIETLMWGSDYPHIEGTWPHTRLALRNTFAGMPEDEVRAILGGNGARVFKLDMDVLQPIVDEIGPTPGEIAKPLDDDEFPLYHGLSFRTAGSFH